MTTMHATPLRGVVGDVVAMMRLATPADARCGHRHVLSAHGRRPSAACAGPACVQHSARICRGRGPAPWFRTAILALDAALAAIRRPGLSQWRAPAMLAPVPSQRAACLCLPASS
ncbi:hypothetical protein XAC3722 [Xanthomonas citri pv. citri str. 306]|uniref:Uncharacterized protein n=1 Tax=Xanthomonas axonopodis pv. citri (strain 306) TaxID=190486 RepID=A0AAI8ETU9_XANAC|nr:hypothetical protein XAC3722 [Xanthomonas citri pv. citri str. 306]